ncbi:MAG: peptidylprolyl isomerase [Bacteroidales bacterium]|nr:peptidylprolyl isomerase [Bacteroidales bacterium]
MIRKQTLKTWLIALCFMMMPSLLSAQSYAKKTLITIGDKEISAKEFMDTYEKNNVKTDVIDKKDIDEYLNLYIDFKLKVTEAEDLKMDTVPSFVKELKNYRDQLAKPYFSNDDITEELVKEAYERMQYDINAAHILIKCEAKALPADTLAAYNKAMKIRERILKGEDFSAVAMEMSDDPSARDMEEIPGVRKAYVGNRGELGYFSAFDMVYPFETGVYTTEIGEVSMPVRSDFGYHIIKVNSKTPALGVVRAAHIFLVADPSDPTKADSILKNKAYNIYNELMKDQSQWSDFVRKYSEDRGTIANNGILSPFRVNQIVPEFITAVKGLKMGEISEPVKTSFGYHIIRLVANTPPADFETEKARLEERVERDMRGKISEEIAMKRIMKDNNFKENTKVKDEFIASIDSTLAMGMYQPEEIDSKKVIFKLGKESCKLEEFVDYIVGHQRRQGFLSSSAYAYDLYEAFLKEKVFAYEDACLEEKYPEFKTLVQEYHDGILLFSLMEEQVWNKAVEDTIGLNEYYERNKNNYMWNDRVRAIVVTSNDKENVEEITSFLSGDVTIDSVRSYLKDNEIKATARFSFYQKGDNVNVDEMEWNKDELKTFESTVDNTTQIIKIVEVRPAEPKSFKEAKGLVTSGYQTELETLWLQQLREKYPVKVNQKILEKVRNNY